MALFTAHLDALMPAPAGMTSWSEARAKGLINAQQPRGY